jgi:hypothetical protein
VISPGKFPWRTVLALLTGCWATVANPCSVSRVLDAPFSPDSYGFYGEVVGHVAMRIPGCETVPAPPDRCAPSWGLRIRILEPLNLPARNLTEVEYFDFGTSSDCRALPVPQARVQSKYPVGARIALAARLFTWDEPRPPRIRLTTLRPIMGEAIYMLPKDADLRTLAATPLDYAGFIGGKWLMLPAEGKARLNFELWRDTLRLDKSTSESEALAILLRMAVVNDTMGVVAEDKYYTAIEQLVDRYLPTPAMRAELLRQLPTVLEKSP